MCDVSERLFSSDGIADLGHKLAGVLGFVRADVIDVEGGALKFIAVVPDPARDGGHNVAHLLVGTPADGAPPGLYPRNDQEYGRCPPERSPYPSGSLSFSRQSRHIYFLFFHHFYHSSSIRVTLASMSCRVARHALGYCLPARKAKRTSKPEPTGSICRSIPSGKTKWVP